MQCREGIKARPCLEPGAKVYGLALIAVEVPQWEGNLCGRAGPSAERTPAVCAGAGTRSPRFPAMCHRITCGMSPFRPKQLLLTCSAAPCALQRSSGGCVYVQNGNSEAWRVGEFLRATRLTYLKARNVTIARGAQCSGQGGGCRGSEQNSPCRVGMTPFLKPPGFSRGYGGGLCIGRGAIVDMEEGVFEDNYSDIDGLVSLGRLPVRRH